jgi:hypothetical protein
MLKRSGGGGGRRTSYFTELYRGSACVYNASDYIMKLTYLRILL